LHEVPGAWYNPRPDAAERPVYFPFAGEREQYGESNLVLPDPFIIPTLKKIGGNSMPKSKLIVMYPAGREEPQNGRFVTRHIPGRKNLNLSKDL
jgi:hypothetical protein